MNTKMYISVPSKRISGRTRSHFFNEKRSTPHKNSSAIPWNHALFDKSATYSCRKQTTG